MKPSTALPTGYVPRGGFDLAKDRWALILLNIVGIALLFVCGWLFLRAALVLSPPFAAQAGAGLRVTFDFASGLGALLGFIVLNLLVIVTHEAIHGLFFWLFTRSRPVFAFKGAYAYAAAPGWYLPRNQYLLVGLAPLVLLSLGGLALLPIAPAPAVLPLLVFMTLNAAGAVGDIAVVCWLLTRPANAYVRDVGDGFTVYGPAR